MGDLSNVFTFIRKNRELFLTLVESLSIEQLNKIPEGYNNNIAWNFGHIVVSTQNLCYLRSGVRPDMDIQFQEKYKKGTKPESFIRQEEINVLKKSLLTTIDLLEEDVKNNVFKNITPYPVATYPGIVLDDIEAIITCTLAHDSLHYGYAFAQRRALLNLKNN